MYQNSHPDPSGTSLYRVLILCIVGGSVVSLGLVFPQLNPFHFEGSSSEKDPVISSPVNGTDTSYSTTDSPTAPKLVPLLDSRPDFLPDDLGVPLFPIRAARLTGTIESSNKTGTL